MKANYQNNPSIVTVMFITICVFVFVIEVVLGGSENLNVLILLGAKYNQAIAAGEYWRLITPVFLHIGIMHLALNMFSLWILGKSAENIYGHFRFALIFLASGVSGNLASYLLNPNAVSAGASTAIYGIIGAMLVLFVLKRHASYTKSIARSFIPMVAINIAFNFVPGSGVDVAGHFGGLACGLVLGAILLLQSKQKVQASTKKTSKAAMSENKYYIRNIPGNVRNFNKPHVSDYKNKYYNRDHYRKSRTDKYYSRNPHNGQHLNSRKASDKSKYYRNSDL